MSIFNKLLHTFALAFAVFAISAGVQAQSLDWAKKFDGSSFDSANALAVDAAGNIYVTGSFSGTVDFDPGPGVFNLTAPLNASNIFVAKLSSSGALVWAKSFRSSSLEFSQGRGIVVDGSGSVYVTGQFSEATDFDPGPQVFLLDDKGQSDIFVAKLTSAGELAWARRMGSGAGELEWGSALALDAVGAVYVTGSYFGNADFGNFQLPGTGEEGFLTKLDSAGHFAWAKSFRSAGGDGVEGMGVAMNSAGELFATGAFAGTVDFDPGSGTAFRTAASSEGYIVKLTSAGAFQWVRQFGGPGSAFPLGGIAVGPGGTLQLSGLFYGTSDFNPGTGTASLTANQGDIFLLKLSSSGTFLWAKRIGGGSEDRSLAVTTDGSGNVYATGYYVGTVDFDPGPGIFKLPSVPSGSGTSAFVLKLSGTGEFQWAIRFGTLPGTTPRGTYGNGIVLDASRNVMTAGQFTAKVDFNPGPETFVLTGRNGAAFVTKVSQP